MLQHSKCLYCEYPRQNAKKRIIIDCEFDSTGALSAANGRINELKLVHHINRKRIEKKEITKT